MPKVLPRSFYTQETVDVAKQLLGKMLCVRSGGKTIRCRIVETEAYLGISDPACHTYKGRRTDRTESMYAEGGHAYVYLIYGMYNCFNVVSYKKDHPEAVLVRAVEIDEMRGSGPGKLCKALGIDRKDNGLDLTKKERIWIEESGTDEKIKIKKTSRVGVDYAGHAAAWHLRFLIDKNTFISRL